MKKYILPILAGMMGGLIPLLLIGADHTYSYDVNTPPDGQSPTLGDDRIRELKSAILERMNQNHYWPLVTVDGNMGLHRSIDFYNGSDTDPCLFTRDVSSTKELFFTDEAGNTIQISGGGALFSDGWAHIKSADANMILENSTAEDADGGRESELRAKGKQSGNEVTTLGYLQFSHYSTGDDQKGKFVLALNDDDDADAPSAIALTIYGDNTVAEANAFIDANYSAIVLDQDTMAADSAMKLATQQSIKAYADAAAKAAMKADNVAGATFGAGSESVTFANGLIFKCGVESVGTYATDNVTYDNAFPGGIISMAVSYNKATGTSYNEACAIRTKSGSELSIAQIYNPTSETKSIYWQVWGY